VGSFIKTVLVVSFVSITGEDGLQVVNIVENIKQSSSENSVVFCQK
jgi:predicted metal-binding protein